MSLENRFSTNRLKPSLHCLLMGKYARKNPSVGSTLVPLTPQNKRLLLAAFYYLSYFHNLRLYICKVTINGG